MTIDTNTAIAFCAFLVALVSLLANNKKDSIKTAAKNEANQAEIRSDLKHIKDNTDTIADKLDRLEQKEQDTREIALYARDRAEAAHSRLDRAGIDNHDHR